MLSLSQLEPVDYLLIGHLTRDLTPEGDRLGGTVAYAALTAFAMEKRVGIVTSWGNEFPLDPYLGTLPLVNVPTMHSTTFENRETSHGRIQTISNLASSLDINQIPDSWKNTPIVHLAPIAQEVEPSIIRHFPSSMICITPQGWLREWDQSGFISMAEWPEASFVLERAGATVLSFEDVHHDEARIDEMVTASQLLVVTEGAKGGRVYWNGDVRRFRAPKVSVVDPVGAGDIFATAFFIRYQKTRNPWEAARFATQLASQSVTRVGMEGIPTADEINSTLIEVL
jgi:sugar/nucleoside kinase (ribokinase family)